MNGKAVVAKFTPSRNATNDDDIASSYFTVEAAEGKPVEIRIRPLNKDASYVDINCDEDLTILLSSGYQQVSTNRAQVVRRLDRL